MNLTVIKNLEVPFPSFSLSINNGAAIYPITFRNEEDAYAFKQWLERMLCTSHQIISHIEKLEKFFTSSQNNVSRLYLKYWLEIIDQENLTANTEYLLNELIKELKRKCAANDDTGGGSLTLKRKFKP